ncbi:uncharacterized protein B0J16DRAFT_61544 [Fusarium flagelliforme]|uniref:Complex 1 LYR protein domain-containing protein n=1 Tax=Fusarium flagelliforme TaxID=2675880 RepID=A0A395MQ08_9HYPO|nr:uncharacterized protein B0J16DRAFT_61544 [Fusarium flagelliforme]KAH7192502.1 hypothetical protein B0J16DRAFT_61544 [Fusarium flagelliforme]RFN50028.1 hypothetical protein FIE12Z_5724 [Fusarium flagelliforme]
MLRQPFVPARNSQHRVAVLALYRALLRAGSSVPLPENIHPKGRKHPTENILRARFKKNKPLTSLRLVYDSMTAGYKFLAILTKGQTKNTREHSEIVRHLKSRNKTANLSRAIIPRNQNVPLSKERRNPPLLTKVSAPNQIPEYKPTVRPLPKTAFVGERKVPVFGDTAEHLSFVRIKKPQPPGQSRSIGDKTALFRQCVAATKNVENKLAHEATSEDLWDGIMDRMLDGKDDTVGEGQESPLESFRFSTTLSKAWWELKLSKINEDWIARSAALSKLLGEERALAKEEKQNGVGSTDPRVAKETLDQILTEHRQKQAELEQEKKENLDDLFQDPFMTKRWLTTVKKMERQELGRGQPRQNKKLREFFGERDTKRRFL